MFLEINIQTLINIQVTVASKDTSCESVVTSGQRRLTPTQHPPRDASPAGSVVFGSTLLSLLKMLKLFGLTCVFLCWCVDFCPLQRKL